MFSRLPIASGCILVLLLSSPGLADDRPFGDLDFSRLSEPQEQFFWKRLKILADEEGVLAYCGQPKKFEYFLEGTQPRTGCASAGYAGPAHTAMVAAPPANP